MAGKSGGGFALVQYNTSGIVDNTFGTGGIVTNSLSSSNGYVLLLTGGDQPQLVVAGDSQGEAYVTRYNDTEPLHNLSKIIRSMWVKTFG